MDFHTNIGMRLARDERRQQAARPGATSTVFDPDVIFGTGKYLSGGTMLLVGNKINAAKCESVLLLPSELPVWIGEAEIIGKVRFFKVGVETVVIFLPELESLLPGYLVRDDRDAMMFHVRTFPNLLSNSNPMFVIIVNSTDGVSGLLSWGRHEGGSGCIKFDYEFWQQLMHMFDAWVPLHAEPTVVA